MLPRRLFVLSLLAAGFLLLLRAPSAEAGLLVVQNTDNDGPGSLRQALEDAQTGDGILFAPAVQGQTIELDSPLVIDKTVGIDGGASKVTLQAINQTRVLVASADMNVANLVITGGMSPDRGGGVLVTNGQFNFHDASVTGNSAATDGGGIYVETAGDAILNNVIVSGNSAGQDGGGIYAEAEVSMDITLLAISDNTAGRNGGGMFMGLDSVIITATEISGNQAARGGGIYSSAFFGMDGTVGGNIGGDQGGGLYIAAGEAVLRNVTVSGNTAGNGGGGILQGADVRMFSGTVTDNNGGGLLQTGGQLQVQATIIAEQANFTDCRHDGGTVLSLGYNLTSDGSCRFGHPGPPTDIPFGFANLDVLADNGGLVRTHALRPGSDALNRIREESGIQVGPQQTGCGPDLVIDARGVSRPQGTACDIGAFELEQQKEARIWGDNLCDGQATAEGAVAALAYAAYGTWHSADGCIGIGAYISGDALPVNLLQWGDTDCDEAITPLDALAVILEAAGFEQDAAFNCPFIGANVNLLG